jgi:hypothetical protein
MAPAAAERSAQSAPARIIAGRRSKSGDFDICPIVAKIVKESMKAQS